MRILENNSENLIKKNPIGSGKELIVFSLEPDEF